MASSHVSPENTTYKIMGRFVAASIEDGVNDPRDMFRNAEILCGFGEETLDAAIAAVDALAAKIASGDPTLRTNRGYGEHVSVHAMNDVGAYAPAYLACITNSIVRERDVNTESYTGILAYCRIINARTKSRTRVHTIIRALQYVIKSGYKLPFTNANLQKHFDLFSKESSCGAAGKRSASDSETSDLGDVRKSRGTLERPDPDEERPDQDAPDNELPEAALLSQFATNRVIALVVPRIGSAVAVNICDFASQLRALLVRVQNCPYLISDDMVVGADAKTCYKFRDYVAMPITEDVITIMWKDVRSQFAPATITSHIVPGVYYMVRQEYVYCMGNIVSVTRPEQWAIIAV